MFFKKVYTRLNKFINSDFSIKFLNLTPMDFYFDDDFFKKHFFKYSSIKLLAFKLKFSFFPDLSLKSYNFLNELTLDLLNFRGYYFSYFNEKITAYSLYDYNSVPSLRFFKKFHDFILKKSKLKRSLKTKYIKFYNFTVFFHMKETLFIVYCFLFFFKKNFSHFFSSLYFTNFLNDNLIKIFFYLYRFFFYNDLSKKIGFEFLNLKKSYHWYSFTFDKFENYKYNNTLNEVKINYGTVSIFKSYYSEFKRFFGFSYKQKREFDHTYFKSVVDFNNEFFLKKKKSYRSWISSFSKITSSSNYNIILKVSRVYFLTENFWKLIVNYGFKKKINSFYPSRFTDSSINKFIELRRFNGLILFFLRKNKIFNKGRYSRNRQTYRTGFYWCLWLNILVVYGLHFLFYRFTFTFGYVWFFLFIFFYLFIFSRAFKFNFINPSNLVNEFVFFYNWFFIFFSNFLYKFKNFFFSNFLYKFKNFFFSNFDNLLVLPLFFTKLINYVYFFFNFLFIYFISYDDLSDLSVSLVDRGFN